MTLESSDISDCLETDAEGKVPTMHQQTKSLVKAAELMREGEEENTDLEDDEDYKWGEDGDITASKGTLLVTTKTKCDMTRRDRRHTIGNEQWSSNIS